MINARGGHVAVSLPGGKVLVLGGFNHNQPVLAAELYDPATRMWSPTSGPATPRSHFTATALQNGTVLVAGGYDPVDQSDLASTEAYDPATGAWASVASMSQPRYG